MTFTITNPEIISALIGILIGYKGKTYIQTTIANVKKAIAGTLTPKS